MNKNLLHHRSYLPLLAVALTFLATACSDENALVQSPEQQEQQKQLEGVYTQFVATRPTTRTTMDSDGNFKWTADDNIWVKEGGALISATATTDGTTAVTTPVDEATFSFGGAFTKESYDVFYTGTSSSKGDEVTIAALQTQVQPNDATHFGVSGDCGVATATRNGDKYEFALDHKASYIVVEPYLKNLPSGDYLRVKKVVVREKNGKDICGTYALDKTGLTQTAGGGSEITLVCGEDIEKVEDGETSEVLKNGRGTYPNGFNVYKDKKPEENRIFIVIAPGDYDLEFEITTAYYVNQLSTHTPNPDYDEYQPELNAKWKGWKFETVENRITCTQNLTGEFKVNHFKRMDFLLDLTDPGLDIEYKYEFEQYYMWAAKEWFWNGVAEYPIRNDGAQATDAPDPTTSPNRYHDVNYKSGHVISYIPWEAYDNVNNYFSGASGSSWTDRPIHDQAHNVGGSAWTNSLTANQMSMYVVYGDPYFDNDTKWLLETYNGMSTICTGGVWLKKKSKIVSDNGVVWPDNGDYTWWSVDQQSARLPYSDSEYTHNKDVYGTYDWGVANYFRGRRFNLRYIAPGYNYRTPLKYGKPSDDGKSMSDYFFVPCLGRIEYQNPDNPDIPTLTLVGGQGFYWTRTPVQYNFGSTPFYYTASPGYDNAFYLNIHYNYIAMSWQQRYDYLKTGMRIATTDIFK